MAREQNTGDGKAGCETGNTTSVLRERMNLFEQNELVTGSQTEGKVRYRLSRVWNITQRKVLWIMLNPSVADAFANDPTIRRVMQLTKAIPEYDKQTYGGVEVINLYSFRATKPKDLEAAGYPEDAHNDEIIDQQLRSEGVGLVVVAWGAFAPHDRARQVLGMIARINRHKPVCFGYCKCGCPRHPLMLNSGAQFTQYAGLPAETPRAPFNFIGTYIAEYKKWYHRAPNLSGKEIGMLKVMHKGLSEIQWRRVIRAYLSDEKPSHRTLEGNHPVAQMFFAKERWLAEAGE